MSVNVHVINDHDVMKMSIEHGKELQKEMNLW